MAWCKLCRKDGGRPSRPLCKHVYSSTAKQSRRMCWCSGVTWGGSKEKAHDQASARSDSKTAETKRKSPPHRWGSSCGKFGCCIHHPKHAEKIYETMDQPVRRVGGSRR